MSRFVHTLTTGEESDPLLFTITTESPMSLEYKEVPIITSFVEIDFPPSQNYSYLFLYDIDIYFSVEPTGFAFNQKEFKMPRLNFTDQLPDVSSVNFTIDFNQNQLYITKGDRLFFYFYIDLAYTYDGQFSQVLGYSEKNGPINYESLYPGLTPIGGFLIGLSLSIVSIPITLFVAKKYHISRMGSKIDERK